MATKIKEEFWSNVISRKTAECWFWDGDHDKDGRPIFRGEKAYRVAYQLRIGPIGQGDDIHHKCENSSCVNPRHLDALSPEAHRYVHQALHKGDGEFAEQICNGEWEKIRAREQAQAEATRRAEEMRRRGALEPEQKAAETSALVGLFKDSWAQDRLGPNAALDTLWYAMPKVVAGRSDWTEEQITNYKVELAKAAHMQLEMHFELSEKQRIEEAEKAEKKAEKAAFDLARRQLEEAKRQAERAEEIKAKRRMRGWRWLVGSLIIGLLVIVLFYVRPATRATARSTAIDKGFGYLKVSERIHRDIDKWRRLIYYPQPID
jgi:hypothetical protein